MPRDYSPCDENEDHLEPSAAYLQLTEYDEDNEPEQQTEHLEAIDD